MDIVLFSYSSFYFLFLSSTAIECSVGAKPDIVRHVDLNQYHGDINFTGASLIVQNVAILDNAPKAETARGLCLSVSTSRRFIIFLHNFWTDWDSDASDRKVL